jgi:hypothetical protein
MVATFLNAPCEGECKVQYKNMTKLKIWFFCTIVLFKTPNIARHNIYIHTYIGYLLISNSTYVEQINFLCMYIPTYIHLPWRRRQVVSSHEKMKKLWSVRSNPAGVFV